MSYAKGKWYAASTSITRTSTEKLQEDSPEYAKIYSELEKSLINLDVIQIEKNTHHKAQTLLLYGKAVGEFAHGEWDTSWEKELWFSCGLESAMKIINNGFTKKDMRKDCSYGVGLYLHDTPLGAQESTPKEIDECRYLFKCNVITGPCVNYSDTCKPFAWKAPEGYQSVFVAEEKHYIVFQEQRAYPAYLITYNSSDTLPEYDNMRKNFKLTSGRVIPEGVGCFLSRFDDVLNADVEKDVSELKVSPDGLFIVEKLDKTIPSSSFDIEMPESIEEWTAQCSKSFLESLEEEFGVVIQVNFYEEDDDDLEYMLPQLDGHKDGLDIPGFNEEGTEFEAKDTEDKFVVSFCNRNITTFPADAMVNSSTPNLDMDGIMSSTVASEAGDTMVNECKNFIENNGQLEYGEVYASRGGKLDFHFIIHVASPIWENCGYEANEVLIEATKNILKEASKLHLRKIATPAICAGGWGFPIEVSLECIFTGIKQYFEQTSEQGLLKYITLIDKNKDVTKEVENVMGKIFGTDYVYTEEKRQAANGKSVTCKIIGKAITIIMKVIRKLKEKIRGVFGPVGKYPATWSPMPPKKQLQLEMIARNSVDFLQLKNKFSEHLPTVRIVRIERVQCAEKYDGMMAYKKTIKKELGAWRDKYEMKLWHGTTKEAAHSIKLDTFRIPKTDADILTDRWHGAGVYFGPTPKVSHNYGDESDGERFMFRSTVMVGEVKVYEDHNEAKEFAEATEPPEGYHSVCVHDPEWGIEYVIFRETQACPDYLITYTKK